MRNALILVLGTIGLAASVQLAAAKQATCTQMFESCYEAADGNFAHHCLNNYTQCLQDGSWGKWSSPGQFKRELKGKAAQ